MRMASVFWIFSSDSFPETGLPGLDTYCQIAFQKDFTAFIAPLPEFSIIFFKKNFLLNQQAKICLIVYICIFFDYLQGEIVFFFCFVNCSHPLPIYLLAFNVFLVRILLAFLYSAHTNPFTISTNIFPVLFGISFGYVFKKFILFIYTQKFNSSNLSLPVTRPSSTNLIFSSRFYLYFIIFY